MPQALTVRVLGCGPSTGVPVIGNRWGDCDPNNPRNRRTRASILVEGGGSRVLIDTSPDMREQLLAAGIDDLDAVLYTHAHADHVHGIDDLRFMNRRREARGQLPVYGDSATLETITSRFDYIFRPGAAHGHYQPFLDDRRIDGPFSVGGLKIQPFAVDHGDIPTLGFRIGGLAYTPDMVAFDEEARGLIAGAAVWIVDCFRLEPHWTHAHLDLVLEWASSLKPGRMVLTHMSHRVDYARTLAACPDNVVPAYDGMVLDVA